MTSAPLVNGSSQARRWPVRSLRWTFAAVLVALLTLALLKEWHAMRPHLAELSPWAVVAGLTSVLLALFASTLAWRALLRDLGAQLPVTTAARIFLVGQLAKYIPGGIWPIVASMELGRGQVPRKVTGAATVLLFPLNVVSAITVAAVALPFAGGRHMSLYAWSLLALPPCIAVLHPRVMRPALNRLTRVLRREPIAYVASMRGMVRAWLWMTLAMVLSGMHIFVLAVFLGAPAGHALPAGTGGWAIAWVVGFLLIPFPGGLGPRDLVLMQVVRPVLPVGAAAVLVVLSRLIFTAAEVIAALVGAGVATYARRRRTREAEAKRATGRSRTP